MHRQPVGRGLLRRATYLRQLRASADVLYFDSGGGRRGRLTVSAGKAAAIFAGENAMGNPLTNLGKAELAIAPMPLKHLAESTNLPLISSNARLPTIPRFAPDIRIFPIQGKRLRGYRRRFAPVHVGRHPPLAIPSRPSRHRGQAQGRIRSLWCWRICR